LIKAGNKSGPRTVPWGTPESTSVTVDLSPSTITSCAASTKWRTQ
jgi:hypothetical protein